MLIWRRRPDVEVSAGSKDGSEVKEGRTWMGRAGEGGSDAHVLIGRW